MKIKKKTLLWLGLAIPIILAISAFIEVQVETGANFTVYDTILGLIIFHNPFVLAIYILISIILIYKSRKK